MAFFKLLTGGHIYAPDDLGQQNILIAGDRIAAIGRELDLPENLEVDRISVTGKNITPGFIDMHVHITGGGGEAGPASRLPEINVCAILSAGGAPHCSVFWVRTPSAAVRKHFWQRPRDWNRRG